MKLKDSLALGLASLVAAVAVSAQEIKLNIPGQTPVPAPAPPAAAAYTEAQLIEEFGWFMGKRVGLPDLGFTPAEVDALIKGVAAAAGGKDTPYDLQKVGPAMDAFMQKKQSVYVGRLKQQSLGESAAFFTKLKENKNVTELPSGLRYEILKPGDGPFPKPSETVKVNYTGTLVNGTVFDSSVQRGQPAEFPLDQVIAGWTEGLQKINKGGKIKLYVPPDLAYGDEGRPGIPPGSTLTFEVELLDIKPTLVAAAAAPAAATPPPPATAPEAGK
jgi:FKBP-type peptidyl-prolyl cis-trans isomerase